MNYSNGINQMMALAQKEGNFSPYPGITIHYPGRKKRGDYRLTANDEIPPTHPDICTKLYTLVFDNTYSLQELQNFLADVYSNGTSTKYTDPILEYLQHLIYWITLQEEINYPRKKGYAGINLAFCRFFEAIYCTHTPSFNLAEVRERCMNQGRNKPKLYNVDNAPAFYHY